MVDYWLWAAILSIVVVVVMIVFIIIGNMRYKYRVVIRKQTSGRVDQVTMDKCREYTDPSGVDWLKRKKVKKGVSKLIPLPPPEALNLTNKGKPFGEVILNENGEYRWITADYDTSKLDSISSKARMAIVNQTIKAEQRKRKDWKQDLPMYASFAFIIVIVGLILILGPDFITTYSKGAEQIAGFIQQSDKQRHDYMMQEMAEWQKVAASIQTIHAENQALDQRVGSLEAKK